MRLYRICDGIILLSRTAVMMIESVSECGLVIQMKYADMNSLSLGGKKHSIFIIVLLFSCSEIQHHTDETSDTYVFNFKAVEHLSGLCISSNVCRLASTCYVCMRPLGTKCKFML